jgi:O-antigen/teichoic acid export membrane protein
MPNDTLKKRYLAKLSANMVGLGINLVTQTIIPRGLGPRTYGNFHFLSNFFTQVVGFLDMGTSIGFYTKLSQRQKDFGLVSFYFTFVGLASLFLFIIMGCVHRTSTYAVFWPGQKLIYIYMAAVWGVLTWIVQILQKMADAYGVTVSTEIASILQKAMGLVLILSLFLVNQLNLTNFFLYHYFVLIFLSVAFIWVMGRKGYSLRRSWRLSRAHIKTYTKELYHYSHPLFIYALVGMVVNILDRWMLQKFSGSVEQGFYSLSYQIGAICFLFTSAMTPLITREFAIAFGNNDLTEMARLFRRYVPLFFAITAYFACFIAMEADKVTLIMGGEKFQQAALAVTIMSFYPIYQTYGQLSGSVFFATGQTGLYRNIGIAFLLVGLPLTYFLLAPKARLGLNAGATGLAIKMIALNFIGVNVQLYFNARLLGLRLWRYVGHQFGCIAILVVIAAVAGKVVDTVWRPSEMIISFVTSGIIYTLLVAFLGLGFPMIFGLSRNDVKTMYTAIWGKIMSS